MSKIKIIKLVVISILIFLHANIIPLVLYKLNLPFKTIKIILFYGYRFLMIITSLYILIGILIRNIWKPSLCFIIFWVLLCTIHMFNLTVEHKARSQVYEFLDNHSDGMRISIEGQYFNDPNVLISKLKNIKWIGTARHSHPKTFFNVRLISKGRSLHLEIARDSNDSDYYWIFYPGYKYRSDTVEIGTIETNVLNSIKGREER